MRLTRVRLADSQARWDEAQASIARLLAPDADAEPKRLPEAQSPRWALAPKAPAPTGSR